MIDLDEIARNLERRDNGIFYSRDDTSEISYPHEGHDSCFQIEEDSFFFRHRNNVITTVVNRFARGATFFDIGGGNGFVSKRLLDEGFDVVLVEPGEVGALNGLKRGVPQVICSSLDDCGLLPCTIPAAGLFDVVEHMSDDRAFLQGVHRYLKPGGYVFLTVPAFNLLWSNADRDAGHFRRYTRIEIGRVLSSAGFEIVFSSYFFTILPAPILLFRTIPSRLGFSKKSHDLKKLHGEHKVRSGPLGHLLAGLWDWEIRRIKGGRSLPFGGSCLLVARKR